MLSPAPFTPTPRRAFPGNYNNPQITFVLHDAGETKAMQPVMGALEQGRINYSILADGTAAGLLRNNPHLLPLPIGVSNPSDVLALANSTPIGGLPSLPKIQAIACLQQLQSASCVLTGVVSGFQKIWASFFKQANRPVIGYYDGFQCNPNDPIPENFLNGRETSQVDALITPSEDTANYFRQKCQMLNPLQPPIPITALGQPILETTAQAMQTTNVPALANRLGIDGQKPTILFVGGYGNHYPQAFRLFCESLRQFPGANVLVSLHPKSNGALESQLLREKGLSNRIKIVPKDIDTTQLLALKPVVLSQDSTFVAQAALQGQTTAYIGQPVSDAPDSFNPLVNKGIVCRLQNPNSLTRFVQQAFITHSASNPANLQSVLGIPQGATRNIVNYLKAVLSQNNAGSGAVA